MHTSKFLFLSLLILFMGCTQPKEQVEVIKIEGLKSLLKEENHEIHIINFWATWCKPCVKEMPQFIALAQKYPEADISLVSLDFVEELDARVIPFLEKKDII